MIPRTERGFTLLEVLVTLVILLFGLLGLLGMATTTIQGNASSKSMATGAMLAEDKIEMIRQLGYNGSLVSATTVTEDYTTIPGFPSYRRVTVTQPHTPAPGLQTITVTVSWSSYSLGYGANTVAMTTLLAP